VTTAAAPGPAGLRVPLVLSTLLAFASISTDLYLPALPTMAAALHADAGTIALTIAGYLVGFSVGQLLWGPVGDRYGRRGPVAIGLLLFVLGSAGCALSATAGQMIGWRVVQAVGACAGVVLARAMVRDLYPRDRAAQMLSTLMTVMAVAPLVGPMLGGQILAFAGWRAIFWTLVAVGLATLAALFALRASGATAKPWRAPSPAMARCCATGRCSATPAPAASCTAACSPMSPAPRSPTSPTTTSRRSSLGCCSPSASSASWRPT
jgi:Bcr/CflA subfamily drug resistance transporter